MPVINDGNWKLRDLSQSSCRQKRYNLTVLIGHLLRHNHGIGPLKNHLHSRSGHKLRFFRRILHNTGQASQVITPSLDASAMFFTLLGNKRSTNSIWRCWCLFWDAWRDRSRQISRRRRYSGSECPSHHKDRGSDLIRNTSTGGTSLKVGIK